MIAQGADMQVVVRLLSLASITTGGIKTKVLENIKREFLQVCGAVMSERLKLIPTDLRLPLFTTPIIIGNTTAGHFNTKPTAIDNFPY